MNATIARARVAETFHSTTGATTWDVIVRTVELGGPYIDSIHLDEEAATLRAGRSVGRTVDALALVSYSG